MSDIDFGNLFDELCRKSEKSNTEIAHGLKVDKATIGRWRSGERVPKLSALPRIAEYFNTDIHMFTGEKKQIATPLFKDAKEAALFIIKNPIMMNYGGYDIHTMSDEELMDTAQDIANYMAFALTKKSDK